MAEQIVQLIPTQGWYALLRAAQPAAPTSPDADVRAQPLICLGLVEDSNTGQRHIVGFCAFADGAISRCDAGSGFLGYADASQVAQRSARAQGPPTSPTQEER
jgi:hypothetical protein